MSRKPIRVTLIHNDEAGEAEHSRSELLQVLSRAGCRVAYFIAGSCDLAEVVELPADIIAVAGGDGTVATVARHLRPNSCPVAVLPLGTANNLAKSIYRTDRSFADLAAGWAIPSIRPFYPIEASGPWGHRRLVEGIGFGAFEQAIVAVRQKPGVDQTREIFAEAVMTEEAENVKLQLEGDMLAGCFPVLEITNIPLVGPNLLLSEAADPSDRRFDVCLISNRREEREGLSKWLVALNHSPAPVSIRTAEQATITGRSNRVRLDGEIWTDLPSAFIRDAYVIELRAASDPLLFVIPE